MSTAPRAFRFGDFTLDLTRGALCAGDRSVDLRPKSFGVLAHLVQNAGRLVPKDELMQAVWPDVVVSDESLAKCVSEARAALGDAEQRLVKTVPRRGYLFDAPVSPANGWSAPRALTKGSALILLLTAVAVIALAVPWGRPAGPPLPARPSIAVLPFSVRDDPQQDYFGDGLTEDLTTSLGRFRELFVVGHHSTLGYKRRDASPAQIGRELGVRYLLEGSVRRDGDRMRITARLLDAATGREIWGESYDRALTGIFAVQDDLTRNIVTSLVAHVDH